MKRGSTMLELIVVMTLMSLLGGAAFSKFVTSSERDLDAASWQLLSDLRKARMDAITYNTRVTVTFNELSYSIWIDHDRDGLVDEGERETKVLDALSEGTFYFYPPAIVFNSMGSLEMDGTGYGYISMNLPGAGVRDIYVLQSGQIDPDFSPAASAS